MKRIFISMIAAAASLTASAQSCIEHNYSSKQNVICVGDTSLDNDAKCALKDLRFVQPNNTLALIASKANVYTYYVVYDAVGNVIAKGLFNKKKGGEATYIHVPEGNVSITFSRTAIKKDTKVLAYN